MSELGAVYISIAEVAKLLGWSRQRAATWLEKTGCLFTLPNGKKRWTTREILKAKFPDIFKELTQ